MREPPLLGKGAFTAFSDPAFFAQARVGEAGRSLEWPGVNPREQMIKVLLNERVVSDGPRMLGTNGR